MQFDNQKTRNVADVVAKILAGESAEQEPQMLGEELVGNQHKIDANKNKKIDAHDFKLLRAQKDKEKANSQKFGKGVKEETELSESHFKVGDKVKCKTSGMKGEVVKLDKEDGGEDEAYYTVKREDGTMKKMAPNELTKINEEVEEILEYESKGGKYVHKGTYGTEKGVEHGSTNWDYEEKMANSIDPQFKQDKKMMKQKYGARQNYVRSKKVGGKMYESFSEMVSAYQEQGLKFVASLVKEEPDNEEFTKEIEDQKDKMEGKKKGADIAKGSVQAVKVEEEYEIIDANEINGVDQVDIEERSLTEPEMKKKEEIVKSMKKGMEGFKQRYGDRAKQVAYATATKIAKEKA
jgi:hypothetical protein